MMKAQIGYQKGLSSHADLTGIKENFSFAWLEGILKAELKLFSEAADWDDLEHWTKGRIFGEQGEYRWETASDGKVQCVLIVDTEKMPAQFQGTLEIAHSDDADLILWGKWVEPEKDPAVNSAGEPLFYANEIPAIQRYPINLGKDSLQEKSKAGSTPRLVVRRYTHPDEGDFIRCVRFEMKTDAPEENIK